MTNTPMPIKALKLPLSFAAEGLKADIASIAATDWITHFNAGYHDGGWSGVALRAIGAAHNLYPDPVQQHFAHTPLLARCPNVRTLLDRFECPLLSVRFLKLRAGSVVREHRDHKLGFEDGEVRLHIPVTTNPDVEFYLDGQRLVMDEGETWYVNVNYPHRVQNLGAADRIHLVIDCKVNEWLATLFASGAAPPLPPAMSQQPDLLHAGNRGLAAFQELVWCDSTLQATLWNVEDTALFVSLVQEAARGRGLRFTDEDIRSAMAEARRAALTRWSRQ